MKLISIVFLIACSGYRLCRLFGLQSSAESGYVEGIGFMRALGRDVKLKSPSLLRWTQKSEQGGGLE